METLPIKLNELSPIIIALVEKIQILDSALVTKQQKLDCSNELLEIVADFHTYFENALKFVKSDEDHKMFQDSVERAFQSFEWSANVGTSPTDFKKHAENAKSLISSVLKLIGIKGCGILIIETYVKLCNKTVSRMAAADNSDQCDDISNFKLLLDEIQMTVAMFKKYWHITLLPNHKNSIALCLNQLCKILPFLLKMIHLNILDVKKFALKMLNQSLNRILEEIHLEGNLQAKDCGQEFLTLMDFSLNKLNGLANDKSDFQNFIEKAQQMVVAIKPMIDEILCYGMSIFQVTQSEADKCAITNSSLKIIREYKDLTSCLNKADTNQIKLNAQSVGESLCAMERHVNTAVLRLILEVFSGIDCPLKNIINKCRMNLQNDNKAMEDLSSLISDFDLEMDKVMQIGLFTISCTSDSSRILGIQSCLASLESLETELIPSLTALYMNCNPRNKSNFQHLIDLWLTEMSELKTLIDSVLDPAGFCQVVENQMRAMVVTLKNALYADMQIEEGKFILYKMTRYSRKLITTLKRSQEDEDAEVVAATEEHIKNFQLAVHECEVACKSLEARENGKKLIDRAYNKAEYLLGELKKLTLHLFELVNEEQLEAKLEDKNFESSVGYQSPVPKKDYYKFSHFENNQLQTPLTPRDTEILTPYLNKGIIRSKRRNLLYTTPSQVQRSLKDDFDATLSKAQHWEKTPVSKKRSRCCKPLNVSLELSNTIDLEITAILDNLSQVNGTFVKSLASLRTLETRSDEKKDAICGPENPSEQAFKASGCCANLDAEEKATLTPEAEKVEAVSSEKTNENEPAHFLGTKLRNRFLQSLNELSLNASLSLPDDGKPDSTDFNTPDRLNDLKIVEEKIDFLKKQAPCILP